MPIEEGKKYDELPVNDTYLNIGGNRIHYVDYGAGKTIILVHGFGLSAYSWQKVLPILARQYHVYAIDLLGSGLSDRPVQGKYSIDAQAALLGEFIEALGVTQAVVVGHSMGGLVSACAAAMFPDKINLLVLISSGFYRGTPPRLFRYLFFPLTIMAAKVLCSPFFVKRVLMNSYYDCSVISPGAFEERLSYARSLRGLRVFGVMIKQLAAFLPGKMLKQVRQPTLIIWGENDRIIGRDEAMKLQQEIVNATQSIIEACGHRVPEEKPAELSNVIEDFLKKYNWS